MSWLFFLAGVIPVHHHRKDPTALRRALRLLARGEIVAFFPEGARTWTGVPDLPMTPAVKFLMGLKVPIHLAAFEGAYDYWPRFASTPRPRRVRVRVVGPLALPPSHHVATPMTNGSTGPWWSNVYAPARRRNVGLAAQAIRSQLAGAAAGEAALLRLEFPERLTELTRVLCVCPDCASAPLAPTGRCLACPACGVQFQTACGGRIHRLPTNGRAHAEFSLHTLFTRMTAAVEARTRQGFSLEEPVEVAEIPPDLSPTSRMLFVSAVARLKSSELRVLANGREVRIPLRAVATSGMMGSETLEITHPKDGIIVYIRKPGGAMRILLTARAHLGLPLDNDQINANDK